DLTPRRPTICSSRPSLDRSPKNWPPTKGCAPRSTASPPCSTPGTSNWAFILYLPHLQAAFRQHLRDLLKAHDWSVDPAVWGTDWGVHIQPAGNGVAA